MSSSVVTLMQSRYCSALIPSRCCRPPHRHCRAWWIAQATTDRTSPSWLAEKLWQPISSKSSVRWAASSGMDMARQKQPSIHHWPGFNAMNISPSDAPSPIPPYTSWTQQVGPAQSGSQANSTSAAQVWPVVISTTLSSPPRSSSPIPSQMIPRLVFTNLVIWPVGTPMAPLPSMAASISRSSCAVSASSPGKSRRICSPIQQWPRPSSCSAMTIPTILV